jgi:N-acetyl-1-D-myo-inositol-2-amino-2-deoxy-alpha-D-glucopyranoside deacetylase
VLVRLSLLTRPYPARHILSTVEDSTGGIPTQKDAVERVLFVHAHPDDETIDTGGTIATLVDRGAAVTVLTCTRGELGEVIPADLAGIEGTDRMAPLRERELAAALAVLGVGDHRFLGDPGARWADKQPRRYTDSGMRWGSNGRAEPLPDLAGDSLCAADFGDVAADIATVIDSARATAVVSYDAAGGYGHPDHVRVRQAAQRAAEVMDVPFYEIGGAGVSVDVTPVFDRKRSALAAHRSQVVVSGDEYALSSGGSRGIPTVESFGLVDPGAQQRATWQQQGFGVHLLFSIVALVSGLALGAIAVVNHQYLVGVVPLGLIVGLVLIAAFVAGCRLLFPGRQVAIFGSLGLLVAVGVLSMQSGGGSILVPASPLGYALTYGPVLIVLVGLAWPNAGTFRRDKLGGTVEPKGKPSP